MATARIGTSHRAHRIRNAPRARSGPDVAMAARVGLRAVVVQVDMRGSCVSRKRWSVRVVLVEMERPVLRG